MRMIIIPTLVLLSSLNAMETSISLGGLLTSGNSEVKQLDAGLGITGNPSASLETGFTALASYGSQADQVFLEKYLTEGSLKYSFTENNYAAARAYWTGDEFSGINYEYGATAGLGRQLINGEVFTASLEAGGGYLSRENTEEVILETVTWYSGGSAEWLATEAWTITETARITGDLEDSDNYYIGSLFEASSAITGNLSFITGLEVTHYNLPPVEGNEKTDTALRIQLRLDI